MKKKWVLFFIIFSLLVPETLYSAEISSPNPLPQDAHNRISQSKSCNLEQVASLQDAQTAGSMKPVASFKIFQNKEDAEKFSEEVKSKGYETSIRDEKTKNNDVIYTVFAAYRPEQSKDVLSSGGAEYEPQSEKIDIKYIKSFLFV